ncbi:hypothetical protein SAMN05428975_3984 [Mucilaginibacter sp. OK268]|jgi:hypothetical protein|uniref:hypothetical protein n=1 Tax=Mucilaginibacter sp. OK268 TaxID=1881048 RepID=UPI00088B2933|nr:hypothetical protein [Mucilaginibacter sp. OK268]SDP94731.1 hypothetical protein SAMN05428975_3984 [Mucilaginibacter sp. OK268]
MECVSERRQLLRQLALQQSALSKARKLFVEDILKFDDYSEFKKEFLATSACLKKELGDNIDKLNNIDIQRQLEHGALVDPFRGYASLDTADKKHLVKLIPPNEVNFQTGEISLGLTDALSKILVLNIKSKSKK